MHISFGIPAGFACTTNDFDEYKHPDFVKCYTYKGTNISTSTIPGPQKGLSLILYGDFVNTFNVPYEKDSPTANAEGESSRSGGQVRVCVCVHVYMCMCLCV